jgi:hypothetical protein
MKLPGRAWLEFRVDPEKGANRLTLNAYYLTQTLPGRVYWYLCLPFHHFIFKNLIRGIEERSVSGRGREDSSDPRYAL